MLILIRGLPGSGKSTMAKMFAGFEHCETDEWFMRDGEYCFAPMQLAEAHQWCQEKVLDALRGGADVVVSNTFVKRWEMQPYINMAEDLGVELKILTATGDFQNTHGVPAEVLERMRANWEPTPERYA